MRFDIKEYEGNFCMHCRTLEEARTFLRYLHSVGRKWIQGNSYLDLDNFDRNGSNTAYYFNQGQFGSASWGKDHGYTVLEFLDFIWDDEEEWVNELKTKKEDTAALNAFLSEIKIY